MDRINFKVQVLSFTSRDQVSNSIKASTILQFLAEILLIVLESYYKQSYTYAGKSWLNILYLNFYALFEETSIMLRLLLLFIRILSSMLLLHPNRLFRYMQSVESGRANILIVFHRNRVFQRFTIGGGQPWYVIKNNRGCQVPSGTT